MPGATKTSVPFEFYIIVRKIAPKGKAWILDIALLTREDS